MITLLHVCHRSRFSQLHQRRSRRISWFKVLNVCKSSRSLKTIQVNSLFELRLLLVSARRVWSKLSANNFYLIFYWFCTHSSRSFYLIWAQSFYRFSQFVSCTSTRWSSCVWNRFFHQTIFVAIAISYLKRRRVIAWIQCRISRSISWASRRLIQTSNTFSIFFVTKCYRLFIVASRSEATSAIIFVLILSLFYRIASEVWSDHDQFEHRESCALCEWWRSSQCRECFSKILWWRHWREYWRRINTHSDSRIDLNIRCWRVFKSIVDWEQCQLIENHVVQWDRSNIERILTYLLSMR